MRVLGFSLPDIVWEMFIPSVLATLGLGCDPIPQLPSLKPDNCPLVQVVGQACVLNPTSAV